MIVGPGGVTRVASWLLNDAAVENAGAIRKLIGDAARYGDQLLRYAPFIPITSLEPHEVETTLSMPHRLVVVDRSARILSSISRRLPDATCHCMDISLASPPETADAVIAFNVICRLESPEVGMTHLAAAVRPGGWLLMDDRSATAHLADRTDFERVAPKIHRRSRSTDT